MSNQTKCRHCDGSGYTYEHTGRDILPVRCSECDNADSHPWNQEMDTEDSRQHEQIAKAAYNIADAMISARKGDAQ